MNTTYAINQAAELVYKSEPLYLGLSLSLPQVDGSGVTEPVVTGNGYARIEVDSFGTAENGTIANTAELRMPRITADSGTVKYWVIYDSQAVGTGNLKYYGPLDRPRSLERGTQIILDPGALELSVANHSEGSEGV